MFTSQTTTLDGASLDRDRMEIPLIISNHHAKISLQ